MTRCSWPACHRFKRWSRAPRYGLSLVALLSTGTVLAQPAVAAGITMGAGDALSGPASGGGLSVEAAASIRTHRRPGFAVSAMAAREWFGSTGSYACIVPCPTPLGRRHLVHALVGTEWWGPHRWMVRGSVGAGTWSRGQTDGWHSGSWQGRVDVASPAWGIVALMASSRVTALDDIKVWSVGAGLVLRLPPPRTSARLPAPLPATGR